MTAVRRFHAFATEFLGGGRGKILAVVAMGWFLAVGARLVFPAMLPFVRETFDMDLATAGLLITVLWIGYGLGQLPGGTIGDRIGPRRTLVLSTLAAAATMLLVSVSVGVGMFFAGTILYGLATAPYGPIRLVVLSDVFPQRDGTAIGLTFAVGNLGTTVLPILATVLATYVSWQLGFGFVVPLFLLATVGLWRWVPARTDQPGASEAIVTKTFVRDVVYATTRRSVLPAAGVSLFAGFVFQAVTGLYPTYLVDIKGFSPTGAATLLGVFFMAGMVIQAVSGVLADRFGAGPTMLVVFLMATAGLFVLPFAHGLVGLGVITVALSGLLGYQPIVQTYLAASLPSAVKGTGLGLLRTVAFVIGALGPVTVGVFADRGFFDIAFLGLGVLVIVAMGLAVLTTLNEDRSRVPAAGR